MASWTQTRQKALHPSPLEQHPYALGPQRIPLPQHPMEASQTHSASYLPPAKAKGTRCSGVKWTGHLAALEATGGKSLMMRNPEVCEVNASRLGAKEEPQRSLWGITHTEL